MNAHLSRIYDMDWSPDDENHLVTAGQDLTVKYWNISNPNKAENVIRLQNTPGLSFILMIMLSRATNIYYIFDVFLLFTHLI